LRITFVTVNNKPMIGRLYAQIGKIRNSLYEKGFVKTYSLGAPAISIGNITVGGTGKTPLVAYVTGLLSEKGHSVCILTRGYGRSGPDKRVLVSDAKTVLAGPSEAGDEPFELAQKLLGKAIVIADADRVAAAAWAKDKFGITAFVLDDAFQHRRAKRDLDIVCIDATSPFGSGKISGMLREPARNLYRADAVVITRSNLVENIEDLKRVIRKYNPACPIFAVENHVSRLFGIGGEEPNLADTMPKKALAFGALGNPDSFFEQLRREGFDIAGVKAFRDHHFYTQDDIDSLERGAKEAGAEILITTMKDSVKLSEINFQMPCVIVESELIFDEESAFRDLIYSLPSFSGGPFRPPQ
jgi:tetraacyldisaccharide 4'-kinase